MGLKARKRRPIARLEARLSGRVPAMTVEAQVRGGRSAYEDLLAAEDVRRDLVLSGKDLWSLGPGASSQLLATWCAFALQTLGEELVKSEYEAEPRLAGYLPVMTANQAGAFLDAGRAWSARARRAAADPGYDVAEEVRLPAELPTWARRGPCPATHIQAMVTAAKVLRDRAQVALEDFSKTPVPEGRSGTAERFQGLYAEADAAVGQGEQMWRPGRYQPLHRAVEETLSKALAQLFCLGQLLARPMLLEGATGPGSAQAVDRLPGQAGFDPWCLSDPGARQALHTDPTARAALEHLWAADPDPAATLALADEVRQRVADGSVAPDPGGNYYYCSPWPTVYIVARPVVIGGRSLSPGQQFTLEVCSGERDGQARFRRGLLVEDFRPTSQLGYCGQQMNSGGC